MSRSCRASWTCAHLTLPLLLVCSLTVIVVSSSTWSLSPVQLAAAWTFDVHDSRYGVCVWSTHAPACIAPPVCYTITSHSGHSAAAAPAADTVIDNEESYNRSNNDTGNDRNKHSDVNKEVTDNRHSSSNSNHPRDKVSVHDNESLNDADAVQPSPVRFTAAALAEAATLPSHYMLARVAVGAGSRRNTHNGPNTPSQSAIEVHTTASSAEDERHDSNSTDANHIVADDNERISSVTKEKEEEKGSEEIMAQMRIGYDAGEGRSAYGTCEAPLHVQLHPVGLETSSWGTRNAQSNHTRVAVDDSAPQRRAMHERLQARYAVMRIAVRRAAAHRWPQPSPTATTKTELPPCANDLLSSSAQTECAVDAAHGFAMEVEVYLQRVQLTSSMGLVHASSVDVAHRTHVHGNESRTRSEPNRRGETQDSGQRSAVVGDDNDEGTHASRPHVRIGDAVTRSPSGLPAMHNVVRCEKAAHRRRSPDMILSIPLAVRAANDSARLSHSVIESVLLSLTRPNHSSSTLFVPHALPLLATKAEGDYVSSFIAYTGTLSEPPCTRSIPRLVLQRAVYVSPVLWERIVAATTTRTRSRRNVTTSVDLTHALQPRARLFRGVLHSPAAFVTGRRSGDTDEVRIRAATISLSSETPKPTSTSSSPSWPNHIPMLVSVNVVLFTYLVLLLFARYEYIAWPTMLGGLNHPVQFYERAFEELDSLDVDSAGTTPSARRT